MIDDDTKLLRNRLNEKISDVQKLTNSQADMMNQLMLANQELDINEIEIATMKAQNEQIQNELKAKK